MLTQARIVNMQKHFFVVLDSQCKAQSSFNDCSVFKGLLAEPVLQQVFIFVQD